MARGRALVTGAGGFIGSHLVERLVREGYSVRALVRYTSSSSPGNLQWTPPEILREVEVVPGNVEDPGAMRAAVSGCDTVFHLAALIGIPYSYAAPQQYVATNVDMEEGGGSISYPTEDPMIRKIYREELAKEGAEFTMPESVYNPATR